MVEISYPKIKSVLESILFIANRPLRAEEIAGVLEVPPSLIEQCLKELSLEYEGKGIQVINVAHGWEMATRDENALFVKKLLESPIETTLSPQALETLAIIAYKQPATRGEIENIRGVISDGVIKTLVEKRLIEEVGRGDGVGRPILYGTTETFLRHFGLKDLTDLPPLPDKETEKAQFESGGTLAEEEAKI
ncbi:MAG: SMC-Scp complex subunit ScpB, partial [Candidatus Saganbacteria bacterium]|nr:SMC-Scp complex subunit ScpB [Candidatus Saganbacteria bacterium]